MELIYILWRVERDTMYGMIESKTLTFISVNIILVHQLEEKLYNRAHANVEHRKFVKVLQC